MTDRGVSIAVSYVLAVGITTLLLSGLLLGVGGMLDQQQRIATEGELRSVGDRISTDMSAIAQRGARSDGEITVRPRYDQPVGDSYRISLAHMAPGESCVGQTGYDGCLQIESDRTHRTVEVPVTVTDGVEVEDGLAFSGSVQIEYSSSDGNVTLRNR